jgi:hypothetical protein
VSSAAATGGVNEPTVGAKRAKRSDSRRPTAPTEPRLSSAASVRSGMSRRYLTRVSASFLSALLNLVSHIYVLPHAAGRSMAVVPAARAASSWSPEGVRWTVEAEDKSGKMHRYEYFCRPITSQAAIPADVCNDVYTWSRTVLEAHPIKALEPRRNDAPHTLENLTMLTSVQVDNAKPFWVSLFHFSIITAREVAAARTRSAALTPRTCLYPSYLVVHGDHQVSWRVCLCVANCRSQYAFQSLFCVWIFVRGSNTGAPCGKSHDRLHDRLECGACRTVFTCDDVWRPHFSRAASQNQLQEQNRSTNVVAASRGGVLRTCRRPRSRFHV